VIDELGLCRKSPAMTASGGVPTGPALKARGNSAVLERLGCETQFCVLSAADAAGGRVLDDGACWDGVISDGNDVERVWAGVHNRDGRGGAARASRTGRLCILKPENSVLL